MGGQSDTKWGQNLNDGIIDHCPKCFILLLLNIVQVACSYSHMTLEHTTPTFFMTTTFEEDLILLYKLLLTIFEDDTHVF